jgi:hypothetical protein
MYRIKIKTKEQLIKEFGLDSGGHINVEYGFPPSMFGLCGCIFEVRNLINIRIEMWKISKDMYTIIEETSNIDFKHKCKALRGIIL